MTVTSAVFENLPATPSSKPFVMSVVITGTGFNDRSMPLVAAVGDVPVHALRTNAEGTKAAGLLSKAPPDGAPLRVGFLNSPELLATPVAFHPPA